MSTAPTGAGPRRAAFTLLELLAVITIVALLTSIVLGVGRRAAEAGKVARARTELAALSAALEAYKRAYGDYPRTEDESRLLQSLLGRLGPDQGAVTGRALIEVSRFATRNSRDPFVDASTLLLDPWQRPYVYAYASQAPWSNSGYVLYSVGPDGKDDATLLAGGYVDATREENFDNLYAHHN